MFFFLFFFMECLIYFFTFFFHNFNLDFFRASILWKCKRGRYLVGATPSTVLGRSFWNLKAVLSMVREYACVFLRNAEFIFLLFFFFFFSHFYLRFFFVLQFYESVIGVGTWLTQLPPTVLGRSFWNFYKSFYHGQRICICFLMES